MPEYDAIVIGGGPSGSAAAHFLAHAGHKVAVLEKKRFPRAKTCGDGLTPRSIRILEEIGLSQDRTDHRVRGLRVLAANRTLELDFPDLHDWRDFGIVRRRRDLDSEIAEAAQQSGAQYLFGVQATEPLIEDDSLVGARWVRKESADGGGVVKVDEGEISARFTLLADGAASPFGRALGLHRDDSYPLGLAIRTYYQSHRHQDDYFESWLDLRKNGALLPGY
jgi:flavin-dependent dehydrogenase